MDEQEIIESLDKTEKLLSKIEEKNWEKEELEKILMKEAEAMGDRGKLLWPLRVALTGKKSSAGPFDVAFVLKKEKVLQRIEQAKTKLQ
ncbi:MAG TPA: hypothetical protein EYO81_04185 [Gammaproteobacteria bacterium]|nr:hypothetical protein [Gammaproteobacteria bacterium]